MGTSRRLRTPPRMRRRCCELDIAFFEAASRARRSPHGTTPSWPVSISSAHRSAARRTTTWNRRRPTRGARCALRSAHNGEALQVLASALMGQHRFVEARELAERLLAHGTRPPDGAVASRRDPDRARRLPGGDPHFRHPAHGAGRARRGAAIRPVGGDPWPSHGGAAGCCATRCIRRPDGTACPARNWPGSTGGWATSRCGKASSTRRERECGHGIAMVPEDHRLLDGMARVALARGRWRRRIDLGERAIARTLDPATLGLLSVSCEVLGDTRPQRGVRAADGRLPCARQPGGLNRAWSDAPAWTAGRDVARVLAKAREEIRTRRDIYAGTCSPGRSTAPGRSPKRGAPADGRSRWARETRRSTSTPE